MVGIALPLIAAFLPKYAPTGHLVAVRTDGTACVMDYGLAKGPLDVSITVTGTTLGTPQYLSPEQARNPRDVDIRTDLYSLGATLYHMVTGAISSTVVTLSSRAENTAVTTDSMTRIPQGSALTFFAERPFFVLIIQVVS